MQPKTNRTYVNLMHKNIFDDISLHILENLKNRMPVSDQISEPERRPTNCAPKKKTVKVPSTFISYNRESISDSNPDLKFSDISDIIYSKWNDLTAYQQKEWVNKKESKFSWADLDEYVMNEL